MSRNPFYRAKDTKGSSGLGALLQKDRRLANLNNQVDEAVESSVPAFALQKPVTGQVRVSTELRKCNIHVGPTGVRSA